MSSLSLALRMDWSWQRKRFQSRAIGNLCQITTPFTGPRRTTFHFKPARSAAPCATDCYSRLSRIGFLPCHREMFNLRPWVSEHVVASPTWLLFLVDVDDDKRFVAFDFEPIAFVMSNAPLFADKYLPDYRVDVKWRCGCYNSRTEQRVRGRCDNDKNSEYHGIRESKGLRRTRS